MVKEMTTEGNYMSNWTCGTSLYFSVYFFTVWEEKLSETAQRSEENQWNCFHIISPPAFATGRWRRAKPLLGSLLRAVPAGTRGGGGGVGSNLQKP